MEAGELYFKLFKIALIPRKICNLFYVSFFFGKKVFITWVYSLNFMCYFYMILFGIHEIHETHEIHENHENHEMKEKFTSTLRLNGLNTWS